MFYMPKPFPFFPFSFSLLLRVVVLFVLVFASLACMSETDTQYNIFILIASKQASKQAHASTQA
jgi:hypothetical protein